MRSWQAHEQAVVSLAFAPAGDLLATAADDEPGVRLWDVAERAVRANWPCSRRRAHASPSRPTAQVLAAGRPWSVELWDPATGDQRRSFSKATDISAGRSRFRRTAHCFSAADAARRPLARGRQAVIWDLTDGRVTAEFVGPASDMPA